MELLQNYRIRKQLGLLEDSGANEAIEKIVNQRIQEALREAFPFDSVNPRASPQRSIRQSITKSTEPSSPRARFRAQSSGDQSRFELMSIVEGLESRIDFLEDRNLEISHSLGEAQAEVGVLRKMNADLRAEREQLMTQVSNLKSVVSSESSAGKVLERVSHTDQLEFKLEIYRQQIAVLSDEISKLRGNR